MRRFLGRNRSLIDEARASDVRGMADVHEKSFPRGWSPEEIASLLRDTKTVRGLVVRRGAVGYERIAGFVLWREAAGEAEILTIAVDPGCRRRGFGRQMMEEVGRRLYRDRAEAVFLEVDESNAAAVSLYRKLGFETVGRRERYYTEGAGAPGTALVMRAPLR